MAYAELYALSNYSFLRSAAHPEALVETAHQLGYRAIAITDECSLAGVVKAHQAAMHYGIALIIGCEFVFEQARLVALAPSLKAYQQLAALISQARRASDKGQYHVEWQDCLNQLKDNLLIYLPSPASWQEPPLAITEQVEAMTTAANDRCWLGYVHHMRGDEPEQWRYLNELSDYFSLPIVACGAVCMCHPSQKPLLDTLLATQWNAPIDHIKQRLPPNAEAHLRKVSTIEHLYPSSTLEQTVLIAKRCQFTLDNLSYHYPAEVVHPHQSAQSTLERAVQQGQQKRWPNGTPERVQALIDKELQLINELDYAHYFLTVYDIVRYARSQQILCQGRGSAANSVVCYCLFISEVNPAHIDVLFERFISKERNEPPDIDVDFEHQRREEVIQYIYQKYGRHRAALAASVVTYRVKSALRDVGRALGFEREVIDHLTSSLAWWDKRNDLPIRLGEIGLDMQHHRVQAWLRLTEQLIGYPRHLSQHVGGFIISEKPLSTLVPVENAAMPERTIIQWDKDDLEAMGMLKIDILVLGMLSAIRRAFALIQHHYHRHIDMPSLPQGDAKVYDLLCDADSVGIFQVESRAQMNMLPRLKPRCYYDLVIEVAIVRPGPIQGDMVHPYLRRRDGIEAVNYPSEAVKSVLARTLGIPIFQEQVIKLAMVAAGFSAGEADQLRRAMAAWKRRGGLEKFEPKLIQGMTARGYSIDFARRLFEQMKGFGEYGFPESHAASFALLVYVSAWLKCHYPAAFYCGLLNSLPMGFYSAAQLIQDAKRHHVTVLPVDIQHSDWENTLESTLHNPPALRLGLCRLKGFKEQTGQLVVNQRQQHPFHSIDDLCQRVHLSNEDKQRLAMSGALASLEQQRRHALWQSHRPPPQPALFANASQAPTLAPTTDYQEMRQDFEWTGLSLEHHPMQWLRQRGYINDCLRAKQLETCRHKQLVTVAGVVVNRQRPGTARGVIFMTLEDETGNINVVVWKKTVDAQRKALLTSRIIKIKGIVERTDKVIHVIAGKLIDITDKLSDVALKSRDFQ